ncbi:MAG: TetR/AcrR family transcriptional regulator [Bacteroidetes bacterium]|nr:MAG: TetR/AcrR family transcriptional regulator [Bacteroidota bacterium]
MDKKKMLMLEQAGFVFLKYGIKSVTMDDMARELGISKKTLYVHFKDKNDLVSQIIQGKIAQDQMACQSNSSCAENAIDELLHVNRFVSEMMNDIHPSVFYDLKKFHQDAWKLLHDHKWEFVFNTILSNILRGKEEGLYRQEIKEEIIAAAYVASTDLILNGDIFSKSEYKSHEVFEEILHFQLSGMVNEKGLKYLKQRIHKS